MRSRVLRAGYKASDLQSASRKNYDSIKYEKMPRIGDLRRTVTCILANSSRGPEDVRIYKFSRNKSSVHIEQMISRVRSIAKIETSFIFFLLTS